MAIKRLCMWRIDILKIGDRVMENLIINGTDIAPEVIFYANGRLSIEGKIITENAVVTFEPMFRWLEAFTGESIEFNINLEYMNTSASMQLYSFLNLLDNSESIKSVKVNWFYEEDDEEHLDTGELFADKLDGIEFHYICISEDRGAA